MHVRLGDVFDMKLLTTALRRGLVLAAFSLVAAPLALTSGPVSADPARSAQTLLSLESRALARVGNSHLKGLVTPVKPIPVAAGTVTGGGGFLYDKTWLSRQPAPEGGPQWRCLAEALYFEARGETVEGLFAVSEVIMNRVSSKRFPNSVCGVVNQGTGRKFACQFTYTCDGRPEHIGDKRAWTRVGKVARRAGRQKQGHHQGRHALPCHLGLARLVAQIHQDLCARGPYLLPAHLARRIIRRQRFAKGRLRLAVGRPFRYHGPSDNRQGPTCPATSA